MKLFTSLAASIALTSAQDFGFGDFNVDSLADLFTQLGADDLANLDIPVADGDVAAERYLIQQTTTQNTFNPGCDAGNMDTEENCDPCLDPSICNGDNTVCVSTDENGHRLGDGDGDGEADYTCNCSAHSDPEHAVDGVTSESCECDHCNVWNTVTESCDRNPCSAAENPSSANTDAEQCGFTGDSSDYQCVCQANFYGQNCESTLPCSQPELACQNGYVGVDDEILGTCTCTCTGQVGVDDDTYTGLQCQENTCDRVDPGCVNGGTNTLDAAANTCTCTCPQTYGGADCSTDECVADNGACLNGGSYSATDRLTGTCTCECVGGYTGANCETPPVSNEIVGTGCWKCDAMTYAQCATEGSFTTCSEDQSRGDFGVCFIEYREQNQKLTQLCTGCKDAKSCDNLKRQNFVPGYSTTSSSPFQRMRNQCKPDYRLQQSRRRYGNTQSVCRQCFSMCSNDVADNASKCFGGLGTASADTDTDQERIDSANWFRYYNDIVGQTYWNSDGTTNRALRLGSDSDSNQAMLLGIPLHMKANAAGDRTMVDAGDNHVFRGYTQANIEAIDTEDGEDNLVEGEGFADNAQDDSQWLYWGLADSTDHFWSADLVAIQAVFSEANDGATDVFDGAGYSASCQLDYGAGQYCHRT